MAERCKGECKLQEYEVRNMTVAEVRAEAGNPTGCATTDQIKGSDEAKEACRRAEMELKESQWILKCVKPETIDFCGCSLVDTPWGEWVKGYSIRPLTVVGCKYTVVCDYEIRSRIRPGGCVNQRYVTAALGFVPDRGIVVELASAEHIEPDSLEKIKDILT